MDTNKLLSNCMVLVFCAVITFSSAIQAQQLSKPDQGEVQLTTNAIDEEEQSRRRVNGALAAIVSFLLKSDDIEVADGDLTVEEDTPGTLNILDNEEFEGLSVDVLTVTDGENGSVVDNLNGTLTYTPNADFNGIDAFTYTVRINGSIDINESTQTVTVNVVVNPVVDVANDSAQAVQNTPIIIDVLDNDTFDSPNPIVETATQGTNGSVVINDDNTLSYSPNTNFSGQDRFSYTVRSGSVTETATVTVNVNATNAVNDDLTVDEDTPGSVAVLDNDIFDDDNVQITTTTQGANGSVAINNDNSVTYTPDADFNGSDSFAYTFSANGNTETATVTVTVNAVIDIVDDSLLTGQGTPATVAVLANDNFEAPNPQVTSVTQGTDGQVAINVDNSVTYTPNASFTGTDAFTYTVTSGGVTETATVNVAVDAANAVNDQLTVVEDNSGTLAVLANDVFADQNAQVTQVTQGANGEVEINSDNTVTYIPNADFNGSDSFTYTVNASGSTDTATVSVTVTAVADAANDSLTVAEDSPGSVNVLANDSFADPNAAVTAVSNGTNGNVVNNNGTVTYTPNADFNGTDSFTYVVTSGGVTETATVNVTITAVADAANDSLTVTEDTPGTVVVLANDNFESTVVQVSAVSNGANGGTAINANGTVTYTPNADFNGTDSFTYTITSGGVTETATVNVTITAVADVVDDILTIDLLDNAGTLNVLANDNFEGSAVVIAVSQGDNGDVSFNANGTVTYTPGADFEDTDSFTYTVAAGGVTETGNVQSQRVIQGEITASGSIFIGNFVDIDPDETDTDNENANSLIDILVTGNELEIVTVNEVDSNNDGVINDNDQNNSVGDRISYTAGGVFNSLVEIDGSFFANVRLVLNDGSTELVRVSGYQTTTGDVFLTNFEDNGALDNRSILALEIREINGGGGVAPLTGHPADAGVVNSQIVVQGAIEGTTGNDALPVGFVDGDGDVIDDGDNIILGNSGDDTIDGDAGNDLILGNAGNDTINAGTGNDLLDGGNGNDVIDGGDGDDTLLAGLGTDTFIGGAGNDTLDIANSDVAGLGFDISVNSLGAGSDAFGNTYDGIEAIVASESQSTDTLTITDAVTSNQVSGINSDAVGIFTPANGDPAVSFGPGQANQLSDLLTGDTPGAFSITSGAESGQIGRVSFENFETINFTTESGITTTPTHIFIGNFDEIDPDNIGASNEIASETLVTGNPILNDMLELVTVIETDANSDGTINDDDVVRGVDLGLVGDRISYIAGGITNLDEEIAGTFFADVLLNLILPGGSTATATIQVSGYQTTTGDVFLADFEDNGSLDNRLIQSLQILEINGGGGFTRLSGHQANSNVEALANIVSGTEGDDELIVGFVDDNGNAIDDRNNAILGNGGDDMIDGGAGNDLIFGNAGDDTINGGAGNDLLDGGGDNDVIVGGDGDDTLLASFGIDTFIGGSGNDTLNIADSDVIEFGFDISVNSLGLGSDTFGNTYDGIENFIARENQPDGLIDTLTVTDAVTSNQVSGISDDAVGIFTPTNGDPTVSFGPEQVNQLSDLLTGDTLGAFSITSGAESGQIERISFENFETINFTTEPGITTTPTQIFIGNFDEIDPDNDGIVNEIASQTLVTGNPILNDTLELVSVTETDANSDGFINDDDINEGVDQSLIGDRISYIGATTNLDVEIAGSFYANVILTLSGGSTAMIQVSGYQATTGDVFLADFRNNGSLDNRLIESLEITEINGGGGINLLTGHQVNSDVQNTAIVF